MNIFRSPLFLLGLLVSIASALVLAVFALRDFWPTPLFTYSFFFGVVIMIIDNRVIRRSKQLDPRRQLLLQSLLTLALILTFLFIYHNN